VTPKAVLKAGLAMLLAAALLLYAGDFAWCEYRLRKAKPNDPLETMTFYYATDIKGGKTEVFFDPPQTATCVHSIFPHGGYRPCWRFNRSGIQRISLMIPGRQEVIENNYLAGWPEVGNGNVLGAAAETAMDLAPFFPTARTAKK
jgi:hypothetical protein